MRAMPRYTANPRVRRWDTKNAPQHATFDGRAYLQTPTGKIRPVCSICPNQLARLAGACGLGDSICQEKLSIATANYTHENLGNIPMWVEEDDASVRTDDGDADRTAESA